MRSLNNLSDFSLDVSNGNFDNYGGITDSLLSAEASKEAKESSPESVGHRSLVHQQPHLPAHQQPPQPGQGPLLDFKSAFSDLESKPSDLRLVSYHFLQFGLVCKKKAAASCLS